MLVGQPMTLGDATQPTLLGSLQIRQSIDTERAGWLALGEWLGCGPLRSYGGGRIRIEPDGRRPLDWCPPLRAPSARALTFETLSRVEREVVRPRRTTERSARAQEDLTAACALARAAAQQRWHGGPLRAAKRLKENGEMRVLAIPPRPDRIVLRAVQESWRRALDPLFSARSHAFRPGRSVKTAHRDAARSIQSGCQWVLKTDLRRFFDEVTWERVDAAIDTYLWDDPLASLVKASIRAPLLDGDRRISRTKGLLQGSPISPLLANLVLHELDVHVEAALAALPGLNVAYPNDVATTDYLRYADDILVMSRTRAQLTPALALLGEAARELGLELHEGKTQTGEVDGALKYLGLPMIELATMEVAPPAPDGDQVQDHRPSFNQTDVTSGTVRSKLARLGLEPMPAPIVFGRLPLHVTSPDCVVRTSAGHVVVMRQDTELRRQPIGATSHVALWHGARATWPAVVELARHGVSLFDWRRRTDTGVGSMTRLDWPIWLAQAETAMDEDRCVQFAQAVVRAKLRNSATFVVRFTSTAGRDGARALARELRALAEQVQVAVTLDAVRGYEGRGAQRYFSWLRQQFDPVWKFERRQARPALDPVNAMLSFAYREVGRAVTAGLVACGLNPRIGLLHVARGRHDALASDLLEEFRSLADSAVLAAVRRNRVGAGQFVRGEHDGVEQCRLNRDARLALIRELESRLGETFTDDAGRRLTYRAGIEQQASRVRNWVMERGGEYRPHERHA